MRAFLAAGAAFLLTSCAALPQQVNTSPAQLAAARSAMAVIDTACADGTFQGVAALAWDGAVIDRRACGRADLAKNLPNTPDTKFKIFSTSKSFTAVTLLSLVEQGRIELDAPIARYLPDIPPAWGKSTVRQILMHRGGIPDPLDVLQKNFRTDISQALRGLFAELQTSAKLAAEPDTKWVYSNLGYELLGEAVARVTGRPLAEVVRTTIFVPARMNDTSFDTARFEDGKAVGSTPMPGLATGYIAPRESPKAVPSNMYILPAAGGIISTAADMIAFDRALRQGRLLSPQMQKRIPAEAVMAQRFPYGYGWVVNNVNGNIVLEHSGGNNGYVTSFARAPDAGWAVIVISNYGFVPVSQLRTKMFETLLGQPSAQ